MCLLHIFLCSKATLLWALLRDHVHDSGPGGCCWQQVTVQCNQNDLGGAEGMMINWFFKLKAADWPTTSPENRNLHSQGVPVKHWKGRCCLWMLQERLGSPTCSYLSLWLGSAAHLSHVPYLHGVTSVARAMEGTRCGLGHLGHSSTESTGGTHANQQK